MCKHRGCIQPYDTPVESGSQSSDAVSTLVYWDDTVYAEAGPPSVTGTCSAQIFRFATHSICNTYHMVYGVMTCSVNTHSAPRETVERAHRSELQTITSGVIGLHCAVCWWMELMCNTVGVSIQTLKAFWQLSCDSRASMPIVSHLHIMCCDAMFCAIHTAPGQTTERAHSSLLYTSTPLELGCTVQCAYEPDMPCGALVVSSQTLGARSQLPSATGRLLAPLGCKHTPKIVMTYCPPPFIAP